MIKTEDDESAIPPRPNLREEVYQRLRRHILDVNETGNLAIPVREADLARTFGVSRTPIREALNRLHQEGLVDIQPRKGVRIIPTSLDEYQCWLEIREVLDGLAARRAAGQIAPGVIESFRSLFADFNSEGKALSLDKFKEFSILNARFHHAIVQASGSLFLIKLAETYDHMGNARRNITLRLGRIDLAIKQHLAIIDALEKGDGKQAEALARNHVRELRDAVRDGLNSLDPDN